MSMEIEIIIGKLCDTLEIGKWDPYNQDSNTLHSPGDVLKTSSINTES